MHRYDYDLFTIGAGSGGVAASRRAGATGARVAICEEDRVGGTCVLRGCVPKKLLVYGTHFSEQLHDAPGYGWSIDHARLNWGELIHRKNLELDRLNDIYLKMLHNNHVSLIPGRGKIIDAHTVQVGSQTYTAENILIATGSWPVRPEIPGSEYAITSNEALDLKVLPKRVVIVGGGYIGVEFSGIFRAAGCDVTLLVRDDDILVGFDADIRKHLHEEMERKGIHIHTHTHVTAIQKDSDQKDSDDEHSPNLTVQCGEGLSYQGDCVMFSIGRRPLTEGLGLEALGIQMGDRGAIQVDEYSRTNLPSLYAVGDVTNRMNLTPVAIAEARALVETLFHNNPTSVDYHDIPTAVFSSPSVGTVGLPEHVWAQRGIPITVYTSHFRPMKYTMSGRQEKTFMKLIVENASQKVVSIHMVGPDSPEIIQSLAVAVKCGATKAQFDATMAVHPTAGEEFVLMRTPRA